MNRLKPKTTLNYVNTALILLLAMLMFKQDLRNNEKQKKRLAPL